MDEVVSLAERYTIVGKYLTEVSLLAKEPRSAMRTRMVMCVSIPLPA
jgi:hypothetical protein